MDDNDERLAVLYAIRGGNGHRAMSATMLYAKLPKVLRERWSQNYLADVILRELIRADLVTVRQYGPGLLHYALTRKGRSLL